MLRNVNVLTEMSTDPHSASILYITHGCMTHLKTKSTVYSFELDAMTKY